MDLTTKARVKARFPQLNDSGTAYDVLVDDLIKEVSAIVEGYLGRGVEQKVRALLFSPSVGQRVFSLPSWPVSSITDLRSSSDGDFSDASTVVDATSYRVDDATGLLYALSFLPSVGPVTLQLNATAGMATTTSTFIAAFPDIVGSVDAEVIRAFKERDVPGVVSQSDAGGSFSVLESGELLQKTIDVLDRYRREISV